MSISVEYPVRPPLFRIAGLKAPVPQGTEVSVEVLYANQIQEIEGLVNYTCLANPPDGFVESNVLSHQLQVFAQSLSSHFSAGALDA